MKKTNIYNMIKARILILCCKKNLKNFDNI